jgi:hypothetical protein
LEKSFKLVQTVFFQTFQKKFIFVGVVSNVSTCRSCGRIFVVKVQVEYREFRWTVIAKLENAWNPLKNSSILGMHHRLFPPETVTNGYSTKYSNSTPSVAIFCCCFWYGWGYFPGQFPNGNLWSPNQTTLVHQEAWKQLFDEFLKIKEGDKFQPFDIKDYNRYVDGLPRYDGIITFLQSRGKYFDDPL